MYTGLTGLCNGLSFILYDVFFYKHLKEFHKGCIQQGRGGGWKVYPISIYKIDIFLHPPTARHWIERFYTNPVLVSDCDVRKNER